MKILFCSLLLLTACGPDISPLAPDYTDPIATLLDAGWLDPEPDAGGLVADAGEDAGVDAGVEDAGTVEPDAGIDNDEDAGYSDDAGECECKNGNGWGDKKHCHHHKHH